MATILQVIIPSVSLLKYFKSKKNEGLNVSLA